MRHIERLNRRIGCEDSAVLRYLDPMIGRFHQIRLNHWLAMQQVGPDRVGGRGAQRDLSL